MLLSLYFYLLVSLDDITDLNIVVRLDIQTAVVASEYLLNIVLKALE